MAGDFDVGMKCIKYMLFVSNLMFVMVGFLLISIGSTITAVYGDFELFMESHHFKPAELLIAVGIIIFFVALFGCVGAVKESTFLVNMYAFMLFILLVLEVAAAIAAYATRSGIYEGIQTNMVETMEDYQSDAYAQYTWDFTQERLYCCGVNQPYDWAKYKLNGTEVVKNNRTYTVPKSCCTKLSCKENEIDDRGCLKVLSGIVSDAALMLGIGATCVAVVQLLGVVFAHMLAKSIRRVKTDEEMRRQENRQRIYEQLARGQQQEEKVPQPVLYTPQSSEA